MSKHLVLSLGLVVAVASAGLVPMARVQAVDLELKLVGKSAKTPEGDGETGVLEDDGTVESDAETPGEPLLAEPATEDAVREETTPDEPGVEGPREEVPVRVESAAEGEDGEAPEIDDSGTDTDDVTAADTPSLPPASGAADPDSAADGAFTIPAVPAAPATTSDTGAEPVSDAKQETGDATETASQGPEKKPAETSAAEAPGSTTAKGSVPAASSPVPTATAKKAPAASPPKKPVLLPGTGSLVKGIGDDFEDEKWQWNYNHPKSSEEQDKRIRGPLGRSVNGRWFEGPKRGTPDVVKRIPLPAPGLDGSGHGLLMATLHAGIPGRVTYDLQQDDLIYNMQKVTGRGIAVADNPSVVVRVYMPPYVQWEKRSGPTFGFRAGCYTHAIITGKDHPDKGRFGLEEYWPGMFVCYEPANAKRKVEEHAYLRIRGGRNGGEIRGPKITETGWWTLGLSFTPDGMVHYFASPGVDELTMDDHITSQFPYGYRTEHLKTFFFNVCTRDDGKTWSTPWVIDDPKVYFIKRQMAATNPPAKR